MNQGGGVTFQSITPCLKNNNQCTRIPSSNHPYLFVKMGPPASGKGSKTVMNLMDRLAHRSTMLNFSLDSIVELDKNFKKISRNIAQRSLKNGKIELTPNNAKRMSTLYYKIRREQTRTNNSRNKTNILARSAATGHKHMVFETTGKGGETSLNWIKQYNLNGYKKVLIFPILPFETLYSRYQSRALKQLQNPTEAVRIFSTKNQLKREYNDSLSSFRDILNKRRNMFNNVYITTNKSNDFKRIYFGETPIIKVRKNNNTSTSTTTTKLMNRENVIRQLVKYMKSQGVRNQ